MMMKMKLVESSLTGCCESLIHPLSSDDLSAAIFLFPPLAKHYRLGRTRFHSIHTGFEAEMQKIHNFKAELWNHM